MKFFTPRANAHLFHFTGLGLPRKRGRPVTALEVIRRKCKPTRTAQYLHSPARQGGQAAAPSAPRPRRSRMNAVPARGSVSCSARSPGGCPRYPEGF